jgi:GDP-L-fucose synthase
MGAVGDGVTGFLAGKRVLVTGGTGFLGRNLLPVLRETGCEVLAPTRQDVDLLEQAQVRRLMAEARPHIVIHLAGLVGGILANRERPAEFCYENLLMGTVVLHESWRAGAAKYVTLIGGCSYPATAANPIAEEALWDGYPQPESAPYALAKRMSVVQAEAYRREHGFDAIALVPGNVYGPHDNFDLGNSHVIPALIRRFHEAKAEGAREVVVWGTGAPVRDFVYVADVCEAIRVATGIYSGSETINISSGVPTTIKELVELVARTTGYEGSVRWDPSKPNGQMLKAFKVTRMQDQLRYQCRTSLGEGLAKTAAWFEANYLSARR